ncbi:MAG: BsuBI/PstI family type II restriction endonuclease [Anaerolineae bacterium]|nr:BsuBI/PstI family type II restriction endonuclease [Anaerolineae bacterium]
MAIAIVQILRKSANFQRKSETVQQVISDAVHILQSVGIPIDTTPRRLERMAMAFLTIANVKASSDWASVEKLTQNHQLKTREIIEFINENFDEAISSGSYDDIRRKDLKLTVAAGIILQSEPDTARNNPNRAYVLNPNYVELIRNFGTSEWLNQLEAFLANRTTLAQELSTKRQITPIPVILPTGVTLDFSPGKHNELQKAIIEEFLPRYGYGAEILYVGDATDKFKHYEKDKLGELQFFELGHGELPDIIAYSQQMNWLYLIEAVHSSGAITPLRLRLLKSLTAKCKADIIYVTAFLDRKTFRRFVADIAWETEVWIAADPDQLIHFDGDKFLGPYSEI